MKRETAFRIDSVSYNKRRSVRKIYRWNVRAHLPTFLGKNTFTIQIIKVLLYS